MDQLAAAAAASYVQTQGGLGGGQLPPQTQVGAQAQPPAPDTPSDKPAPVLVDACVQTDVTTVVQSKQVSDTEAKIY